MYRSLWRAKERAAHDLAGVPRRKMPSVQANIEASVQLLSVGCAETSPACLVISDRERFMINVGEGSQRLAMEHRVRIVRYDHIFITSLTTECIGGLPGMLLTLADQGKKSITLHGPVGLRDFYYATRHFMRREELRVDVREYTTSGLAAAGANLTMYAVPLGAFSQDGGLGCDTDGGGMGGGDGGGCGADDDCDGGGDHEAGVRAAAVDGDMSSAPVEVQGGGNVISNGEERGSSAPGCHGDSSNVGSDQVKGQRDESQAQQRRRKRPRQGPAPKLIAWVGETAGVHGKFDVARAKALGISAGPLYGKLKGGEAVELSDGRVIQPEEVVAPSIPGVVYAIFHCPSSSSIAHLPSVEDVCSSLVQGRDVSCVVHMTPYDVLCTEAYQAWSKSFGDNTTHMVASLPTSTSRSPFRASKLNNLRLHILDDQAFPRALGFDALPPLPPGLGTKAIWGDSLLKYTLLPKAKEGLDTSLGVSDVTTADETRLRGHVESVRAMAPSIPDAPAPSTSTNGSLTSHSCSPPDGIHPPTSSDDNHAANVQVMFLGTGAALPSKYRNVTGIMVVVRKADGTRAGMLLDCGEGTLGQLASLYRGPELDEVLRSLCAVWISHPHADHHLGLTRVVAARKRLLQGAGSAQCAGSEPLVVLAPKPVLAWLKAYQAWDPDVCWGGPDSLVELAPGSHTTPSWAAGLMKDRLGVSGIHNVRVEHCPHAYALVLDHQDGWRLVYSGDLRPSDKLIKAGEGAMVLIHEATFEAAKHGEAVDRKHCTVDEALEVARRMRASSVLLTHFSQRYPKFPVLPDDAGLNVCVAFDLMTVKFEDLTRVAQLLPVLQQLFPGEEEEESEDGEAEQVESGAKEKEGGGEKPKQKKKGKEKVKGEGNVEGGAKGGTTSKGKAASSL